MEGSAPHLLTSALSVSAKRKMLSPKFSALAGWSLLIAQPSAQYWNTMNHELASGMLELRVPWILNQLISILFNSPISCIVESLIFFRSGEDSGRSPPCGSIDVRQFHKRNTAQSQNQGLAIRWETLQSDAPPQITAAHARKFCLWTILWLMGLW